MEENVKLIESLLERASEYGKTSYELIKLKTLEKISDVFSSFIPHFLVFIIICACILFSSLGLAFWLSEILGKIFYGFLVVAAFYAIVFVVLHFFMHKWLKKKFGNYFIKQVFK